MAKSAIAPVRSSAAASLWASLTFTIVLPLSLGLFFQLLPIHAWSRAVDGWLTVSLTSGSDLLRSQGYQSPTSLWEWLWSPIQIFVDLWPHLSTPQVAMAVILQTGAAIFASLSTARLVYRRVRAEQPPLLPAEHVVGPLPQWGGDGVAYLRRTWDSALRHTGHGVSLSPDVTIPMRVETEGLLLVGRPGSGKSVVLEGLMAQAIARGDRVIALDVKGGLSSRLRRHRPRVLSIDMSATSVWAIGRDLRTMADADEFAASLVPESRDPVWGEGSRLLLSALVQHLQATKGARWGWRDLDRLLNVPVVTLEPFVRNHAPAVAQLMTAREEPTNFLLSLSFNLTAHTASVVRRFGMMEKRGAKTLSLRNWMRNDGAQRPPLIIHYDLAQRDRASTFARLVLRVLSTAVLGGDLRDGIDSGTWFMLDEVTRIGRCDPLIDLASLGRSRGVRCAITVQSSAQLIDVYNAAGADALKENFGLQIICALPPGDAAKKVSENWIGDRTVSEPAAWVRTDRVAREWTVPALAANQISGELGLRYDLWGRPLIRAAVIGSGDVAILDWALHRWAKLG